MTKKWWRSKTVWLGVIELLIGMLMLLADSELTGRELTSALLAAAGVLTIVLRFLTDRPLAPVRRRKINAANRRSI